MGFAHRHPTIPSPGRGSFHRGADPSPIRRGFHAAGRSLRDAYGGPEGIAATSQLLSKGRMGNGEPKRPQLGRRRP